MMNHVIEHLMSHINEYQAELLVKDARIVALEEEVTSVKGQLDDLEQHNRKECLRVKNLSLDPDRMHSNHYVKQEVYGRVLRRILERAAADPADDLAEVPSCDMLLKNAHILPVPRKAKNNLNPIIVRLNLMDLRSKLFKYKKSFQQSLPGISDEKPNITEDLTRLNQCVLSRLYDSKDVAAAWTIQGNIIYTEAADKAEKKKRHRVQDPFTWLTADDLKKLQITLPCSEPNETSGELNENSESEQSEEDGS